MSVLYCCYEGRARESTSRRKNLCSGFRGMPVCHPGHPDGNYQTVSKVAVLDPPRAIGWLTGQELGDGELEFGGWLWR